MNYLASFVRKNLFYDFCLPELISVCEMYNAPLKYDTNFSFDYSEDPLIHIDIPFLETSNIGQLICDRSLLTKFIIKLYSQGMTYEELLSNVDRENFLAESDSTETFKFEVDCRGRSMPQEEKVDTINLFHIFNFKGKVNIKKAKRIFVVIDNFSNGKKYFGKLIASKADEQYFYSKYSLDTRKYLGPTTTDNVLGFLMVLFYYLFKCNLAQIKPNDYILDPFVGTGSLLIPPSHFNAITVGCDIDIRVLRGYSIGYTKPDEKNGKVKKGSNIFTNFKHYGLSLPQIFRSDINIPSLRYGSHFFDAIVCDPPYGDRAFSRKTGLEINKKIKRQARLLDKYGKLIKNDQILNNENDEQEKNESESKSDEEDSQEELHLNEENVSTQNIPTQIESNLVYSKENAFDTYKYSPLKKCPVNKIFDGLLSLGSSTLKSGGILVCLFPVKKRLGFENENHCPVNFPRTPEYDLLYSMENAYSSLKSRWCLVYRKK